MSSRVVLGIFVICVLAMLLPGHWLSSYAGEDPNRGWHGIVPLHATRTDVEKLLGPSAAECHCRYSTPSETINFDYSKGPCKGPLYGWKAPVETVLRIRVYPKQSILVSEAELLPKGYIKSHDPHENTVHYTNVKLGIKYAVNGNEMHSITYIPSSEDVGLRCQGFPAYDGGIREYYPFATFSTDAQMIDDRIDEFGFKLADNPVMTGYIITYAGAVAKKGEASMMAENAKRRIVERIKITPSKIITIDGGFRETADYELFLVPPGILPPAPTPTVASNEAKIIVSPNQHKRRRSTKLRN